MTMMNVNVCVTFKDGARTYLGASERIEWHRNGDLIILDGDMGSDQLLLNPHEVRSIHILSGKGFA